MPTAFRATYSKGKPHIALLAEYDALPGIGMPADIILSVQLRRAAIAANSR